MLVLPPELVPDRRDLPRYGWVLARAFTPAWAAPALWLPYTGQLYAAHALRGLATHSTDHARAVAVLRSEARGPQIVLGLGILAGIAVLYALILAMALASLEVFDVRSPAAAAPAYLLAAWPAAAGLVLAWPARRNLGRSHPQQPNTVRIGSLAAHPPGKRAGRQLGQKLCEAADTQQVTLDLTARTPALVPFYTRAGFTQPDPHRLWMLRSPVTPAPDRSAPALVEGARVGSPSQPATQRDDALPPASVNRLTPVRS